MSPVLLLGAMVVELGVRPMQPSMAGLMLLALKVSGGTSLGEEFHGLFRIFERHIGSWWCMQGALVVEL